MHVAESSLFICTTTSTVLLLGDVPASKRSISTSSSSSLYRPPKHFLFDAVRTMICCTSYSCITHLLQLMRCLKPTDFMSITHLFFRELQLSTVLSSGLPVHTHRYVLLDCTYFSVYYKHPYNDDMYVSINISSYHIYPSIYLMYPIYLSYLSMISIISNYQSIYLSHLSYLSYLSVYLSN